MEVHVVFYLNYHDKLSNLNSVPTKKYPRVDIQRGWREKALCHPQSPVFIDSHGRRNCFRKPSNKPGRKHSIKCKGPKPVKDSTELLTKNGLTKPGFQLSDKTQ